MIRDPVFDKWWPLAQSLLLIKAKIKDAAFAIEVDGNRLQSLTGQKFNYEWVKRSSLDDLFGSFDKFTHYPTQYFAVPTHGDWTVVWDNCSHRTDFSSMAHCLTNFQWAETFHFASSDKRSTTLAGTHFTHYKRGKTGDVEVRSVYCGDQGSRWQFEEQGEPLAEEDLESYKAKRKRDRLNEQSLMALLERLGIQPWRESTYDFAQPCFLQLNEKLHRELEGVDFAAVRKRATKYHNIVEAEEKELVGPPDYLQGKCRSPKPSGPSRLLADGDWCGHGEKEFWIYDIEIAGDDRMSIRLPAGPGPPVVEASPSGKDAVAIYDSRRHRPSVFIDSKVSPEFQPALRCPTCGSTLFRASVGFEVPFDCQSPNDTSWFALALECSSCGFARIVYDDETA